MKFWSLTLAFEIFNTSIYEDPFSEILLVWYVVEELLLIRLLTST